MISLMSESYGNPTIVETGVEALSGPSSGSLTGIVGVLSNSFDNFDFDAMVDLNPDQGLDASISDAAPIVGAPLMEAAEWTSGPTGESAFVAAPGSAAIATPAAPPLALDPDALPLMDEDSLMVSPKGSTPSKAEQQQPSSMSSTKVESDSCCKICGYRPKGDPRWFVGSMAKHMRTIHSENPQVFRCPYPGCTSQYSKRADNLRQHQIEKGHFVDDEGKQGRRPRKRKRPSDSGGE